MIDLPELCNEMSKRAKRLGVEIFECCAVKDVVITERTVVGVELADGSKLFSKHVFLAEGASGSVTAKLLAFHDIKVNRSYAIGIREE